MAPKAKVTAKAKPSLAHPMEEYIALPSPSASGGPHYVWIWNVPNRISKAREAYNDFGWEAIRTRLATEFATTFADDDWDGLRQLLCLKAAFHDVTGHAPFMFGPQSKRIDKSWHSLILASTFWYLSWCQQMLGCQVHHTGISDPKQCKLAWTNTCNAIKIVFPKDDIFLHGYNDDKRRAKLPRSSPSVTPAKLEKPNADGAAAGSISQSPSALKRIRPRTEPNEDEDDESEEPFQCCC